MHKNSLTFSLLFVISHPLVQSMDYDNSIFLQAKNNNSLALQNLVVHQGISVNIKDLFGNTPLHVAAHYGKRNALERCIALGALINTKNKRGNTPLHEAVREANINCVQSLLEHGAMPSRKSLNGKTPLHLASALGDKAIVELLLNFGANPNKRDNKGKTALGLAQINNFPNTFCFLVSRGANPSLYSKNGYRASHTHSVIINNFFKELDTMKQLLFEAVQKKQHSKIGQMITCDTPINIQDSLGNTPLHYAVLGQDYPTIFTLLSHGADPTIENKKGLTPINYALCEKAYKPDSTLPNTPEKQHAITQFLKRVKFFIQASSVMPCQLWKAIQCNQRKKTEVLITYAQHPIIYLNIRTGTLITPPNAIFELNPQGNSPLHLAATVNSPAIVSHLLHYGLDPKTKNHHDRCALDIAKERFRDFLSPCTAKIYLRLYQATQKKDKSPEPSISTSKEKEKEKQKEQEQIEICCICQEPFNNDRPRIYLAPCSHNNICVDCAWQNFFPSNKEDRQYHYRQVCPICRGFVDLKDLKERLKVLSTKK